MKIQWLSKIAAVSALLFAAAGVNAGVITDTVNVNQVVNNWDYTTWTHDINDDGFTLGTAQSATLAIEFADDESDGWLLRGETATIIVGIIDFLDGAITYNPVEGDFLGDLGITSLVSLNASGMIDVSVGSLIGDFYVGESVLTVTTADVPEPSSLALFGLGLLGLGVLRRKQSA